MSPVLFEILAALASVLAGAIAAVSGFGIGSVLTPLLSLRMELKLAVAVAAIPHLTSTAIRLWMLRSHVVWREVLGFGLASAAGGLAGAILRGWIQSPLLSILFGALLVFVGISGLTGLSRRMRIGRKLGWVAGGASGLLGGLVGNQGGIRSAGLLGFELRKEAFVASATAIGLVVDLVRVPVYLVSEGRTLLSLGPLLAATTAGGIVGTLLGMSLLHRIPERIFQPVVSALILALGLAVFVTLWVQRPTR
jgi:uncharacterized protein